MATAAPMPFRGRLASLRAPARKSIGFEHRGYVRWADRRFLFLVPVVVVNPF